MDPPRAGPRSRATRRPGGVAASPFAKMTPPRRYTVRMVALSRGRRRSWPRCFTSTPAHFLSPQPAAQHPDPVGPRDRHRVVAPTVLESRARGRVDRAVPPSRTEDRSPIERTEGRSLRSAAPPVLGPLAILLAETADGHDPRRARLRSALDSVDNRLSTRGATRSRYLIALLIFLGLLGTFWGPVAHRHLGR